MAALELRISHTETRVAGKRDLSTHDKSVECNWALISDLESQCVKLWSMFKPSSVGRNCVSSARVILLDIPGCAFERGSPWLLVYLRWWTWSQKSESCWLWRSPPCCQCGCTSGRRWTLWGQWPPGRCLQSSGLELPVAWLKNKGQTKKTTSTWLMRLWFNTTKQPQLTSTKLLRNSKSNDCEPCHCQGIWNCGKCKTIICNPLINERHAHRCL